MRVTLWGGILGVECGNDEVSRFSGGEGGLKGLAVSHFADDDDIGVLAQGMDEGGIEGFGVQADFTLLEEGALVLEGIFDGVFDGDDMAFHGGVDVIQHGGHGG